jgi:hypothetical protein
VAPRGPSVARRRLGDAERLDRQHGEDARHQVEQRAAEEREQSGGREREPPAGVGGAGADARARGRRPPTRAAPGRRPARPPRRRGPASPPPRPATASTPGQPRRGAAGVRRAREAELERVAVHAHRGGRGVVDDAGRVDEEPDARGVAARRDARPLGRADAEHDRARVDRRAERPVGAAHRHARVRRRERARGGGVGRGGRSHGERQREVHVAGDALHLARHPRDGARECRARPDRAVRGTCTAPSRCTSRS